MAQKSGTSEEAPIANWKWAINCAAICAFYAYGRICLGQWGLTDEFHILRQLHGQNAIVIHSAIWLLALNTGFGIGFFIQKYQELKKK